MIKLYYQFAVYPLATWLLTQNRACHVQDLKEEFLLPNHLNNPKPLAPLLLAIHSNPNSKAFIPHHMGNALDHLHFHLDRAFPISHMELHQDGFLLARVSRKDPETSLPSSLLGLLVNSRLRLLSSVRWPLEADL